MKSTLLAIVALIGGAGGAAGLYFAHPEWAASPSTPEPEQAASDTSPTPIPLVERPQEAATDTSNPFAQRREPQTVDVVSDRYAETNGEPAVDANQSPAEIPDASDVASSGEQMPATASADPFGLRERSETPTSRYAEQPASAEAPDVEPANESTDAGAAPDEPTPAVAEPRRLSTPATEKADRYARPLEMNESATDPSNEPNEESPSSGETVEAADDTTSADRAEGVDGTGRPGDPNLNGSQAPTLTIEKSAPPEIQIGKPARFVIKVRNTGTVTAHGVEIHDTVPQGTQLIDTSPAAKSGPQGTLVWDLGSIKPGEEQTAQLQLMPMNEGEIGSVATVHFRAEASVRTVATKPLLNMEVFAPSKVMKGEEVTLKIKLSNPGSGAATGVMLNEAVPEGLKHSGGHELEFEVGTLKPGETRELELGLMADAAGQITNTIVATADASLEVEAKTEIEVIAPQLQVSLTGPKRRYLERNATHNISVTNPGTAAAKDIELAAALPRELKFVEANNGGQYDAATHSVYWSLEELPPQETGTVTLVTLPQQPGEAKLTIKSTAQAGLADQRDEVLSIQGLAAVNFQLSDINDPIEVNGQTSYEVRVTNQGTKSAVGVRLVAIVPREMKPISAEGPVRYKLDGQRIVFDPLKQLAPKADTAYTIKVKALEPGDVRLQVQVSTDDIREPVSKEESTRIFGDE